MRYQFTIDRGGTFTDCIVLDKQTGRQRVTKVLSGDDAPLVGIRQLLNLPETAPIPPSMVRLGTTVATNALLERRGARTALVITRGFSDLLEIGDQSRPELFKLDIRKPDNLYARVEELNARLDPRGAVLANPTEEELGAIARRLHDDGIASVALCVLHAYAAPHFELQVRRRLERAWPGKTLPHFSHSTQVASEIGFLARTSTCVLSAYVTPLLKRYMDYLAEQLPGSSLSWMQSSGGLCSAARFAGPQAVLSGPAGGIIAAEHIAKELDSARLITFDMGGTSTDVALILGKAETTFRRQIAGTTVLSPMLDIHTVAAGGGSVCAFDGYALTVGPESVGANPGPLCYGNLPTRNPNGEAEQIALSDVNLLLGRLGTDYFPFPLDRARAREALERVAESVGRASGEGVDVDELCRGFAAVATTNMAEAIRTVTVRKGVDAADADLLVFGGAAGQHACAVASALGIQRILAHRLSGVLSAYGIGLSERLWSAERDAGRIDLSEAHSDPVRDTFDELVRSGQAELLSEGAAKDRIATSKRLSIRYVGTETPLEVDWGPQSEMRASFEQKYQERFGYTRPDAALELVALRVFLTETRDLGWGKPTLVAHPGRLPLPSPKRRQRVVLEKKTRDDVPVFDVDQITGCVPLSGPALLLDETGTYLVEQGFVVFVTDQLVVLEREATSVPPPRMTVHETALVQIVATRFAFIAEQMGEALRRTASSTNIVDRLDFSCAVFDAKGRLVANAPHIPVHLGAMSESVAQTIAKHPKMQPGDSYVTNDPNLGGSHLPDITVVTPLFSKTGELTFFTASRGHHADVGGVTPGSMPAFSSNLEEEGIVLSAELLVREHRILEAELRTRLAAGRYPARNPDENIADLQAQLAANRLGAELLMRFCDEITEDGVTRAMHDVRNLAARWMRDAIRALPNGRTTFADRLDSGSRIEVAVRVDTERLLIDFSNSSDAVPENLNAPRAVTVACVLYVLRTLLDRPLPLNQGCLEPVEMIIPRGSILNPQATAPVAAGNVETSQRIVDVLLGALGLAAASQGTMNNLSFGTSSFGYYETIAGGAGAGPGFSGAHAVHTHMTNTRITDPEILERRFPVRLTSFGIRRGSGGAGRYPGGDGVERELEALTDLDVALLTERRLCAPFGLEGGQPGKPGRNLVDGAEVPGRTSFRLERGQRLRIETPGGGGFGAPP